MIIKKKSCSLKCQEHTKHGTHRENNTRETHVQVCPQQWLTSDHSYVLSCCWACSCALPAGWWWSPFPFQCATCMLPPTPSTTPSPGNCWCGGEAPGWLWWTWWCWDGAGVEPVLWCWGAWLWAGGCAPSTWLLTVVTFTVCDMCSGPWISLRIAPVRLDPLRLACWSSHPVKSQFCKQKKQVIFTQTHTHTQSQMMLVWAVTAVSIQTRSHFQSHML